MAASSSNNKSLKRKIEAPKDARSLYKEHKKAAPAKKKALGADYRMEWNVVGAHDYVAECYQADIERITWKTDDGKKLTAMEMEDGRLQIQGLKYIYIIEMLNKREFSVSAHDCVVMTSSNGGRTKHVGERLASWTEPLDAQHDEEMRALKEKLAKAKMVIKSLMQDKKATVSTSTEEEEKQPEKKVDTRLSESESSDDEEEESKEWTPACEEFPPRGTSVGDLKEWALNNKLVHVPEPDKPSPEERAEVAAAIEAITPEEEKRPAAMFTVSEPM